VVEEPVSVEPVSVEPVEEEPVSVEEPVVEEPVSEEPGVEEPVSVEPVEEELVVKEHLSVKGNEFLDGTGEVSYLCNRTIEGRLGPEYILYFCSMSPDKIWDLNTNKLLAGQKPLRSRAVSDPPVCFNKSLQLSPQGEVTITRLDDPALISSALVVLTHNASRAQSKQRNELWRSNLRPAIMRLFRPKDFQKEKPSLTYLWQDCTLQLFKMKGGQREGKAWKRLDGVVSVNISSLSESNRQGQASNLPA